MLNAVLASLFNVIYIILLVRIIMSWLPMAPGGFLMDLYEVLYAMTEPLLAPIRRLVPPLAIGLDLSPLILLLLIRLIQGLLI